MPATVADVGVWLTRPHACARPDERARFAAWLDDEERARWQRYARQADRDLFLAAHALLRATLSHHAQVPPEAWRFQRGEHGRPEIAGPNHEGLRFSLTHCPDLCACIVTQRSECGIDAEDTRRVDEPLTVAREVFSERENTLLQALPPAEQRDAFFLIWVLKESYLKARGVGFAASTRDFSFDIDPPQIVGVSGWQHAVVRPGPQHLLAVTIATDAPFALRVEEWAPGDGSDAITKA